MLRHYIKTAWRSLLRSKGFSAINIAGLAIGMASVILIGLWLRNMVSTDRFYQKEDQLYILSNRDKNGGNIWAWQATPKILGPTLKREQPAIEAVSRYNGTNFLFTSGNIKMNAEGAYVDSSFLDMFDMKPLFSTNKYVNALAGNDKIVLTQAFAKSLFGNTDPVGKPLMLNNKYNVTVSAVIKDLPSNTQFAFDYLLSWGFAKKAGNYDEWWGNNSVNTFIQLRPHSDLTVFNNKIKNTTIDHSKSTDAQTTEVFAFPLSKRFLYNKDVNGQFVTGNIVTVRLFSIIALLILIIACINFMNLSTARSERRAKEVGVRKVIGAYRRSLIGQFLSESILLSILAFMIAIAIVVIALPFFNQLVGKELTIPFGNLYTWLAAVCFVLFTGLLAGSYPALFLSSFRPVKVLKGAFRKSHSKISLRSVLVVIQFTFSIILIIATVIVSRQIKYTQQRDNGYAKNGLIYTPISGQIEKNYLVIKHELLSSGAVLAVSKNMSPITRQSSGGWGGKWPGSTPEDEHTNFARYSTDADFVKTMGVQLISGRDIDIYKYPGDSTACLLNEAAVKTMHIKNPVGLNFYFDTTLHVVGVVKDFVINGAAEKVHPMIIFGPGSWFNDIHYRLNPNRPTEDCLKQIKAIFNKYNPEYPYQYAFVDKDYAKKFAELQQTSKLSSLFAGLTIFISCLGLLGLIIFMAETRTKEIGVRKVLGASVFNITKLLSWQFLKLVGLSFLIATPIAWYAMHKWLQNFDYKVHIEWWWFVAAGALSLAIALITVSWQAIKAARTNPVQSLKTE
ncbi:ABC transporter permease [Arachidicoccus terrestris]|uniref:ABC transporter permease n=1 Tax=Arachidicoccus terrestris TaxID=2875539 RepID=UPI001CC6CFC4|nr:ABC transporter permease [Arachidicoccus terrestris]UAY55221.1 ABC transporter permease [Arachidicoccus terrestris]